jgi:hypothetical protein
MGCARPRSLLISAEMHMHHARAMAPELMRSDPRRLAAVLLAASNMVSGAHSLMSEARNSAERAMKKKSLLVLPSPVSGDGDDDERQRTDIGPPRFAGIIDRFRAIKVPGRRAR